MCQNKGEYKGTCNLSSCTSKLPANWYNWGSRAWYCKPCAMRLSADPINAADAQRTFGHSLCTEGKRMYCIIRKGVHTEELDKAIVAKIPVRLCANSIVFESLIEFRNYIHPKEVGDYKVYFALCSLEDTYVTKGRRFVLTEPHIEPLK